MAVRVGVIGVGYLGRHHARIYSALDSVELVGVADPDPQKRMEIAGLYGCKAFEKYHDLLGLCDAVSIATPTTTHYQIALDCLRAGKDLLVEKPITVTIQQAEEIINEAAKKQAVLQVGHLERYNPAVLAAADMISGARFVESARLSPFLGRATDVDVTIDLMIHDVDILLSIIPAGIVDIRAAGESVITDKLDAARAWIEFDNGAKALLVASRLAQTKQRELHICKKDFSVTIDFQAQELRKYYRKGTELACDLIKPETNEPLKEELRDFTDCVRMRRKPLVSGEDALQSLAVVLKINDLAKESIHD